MDFNVHDSSGVLVGIVEQPTSAIWARRYHEPNDFELYFPVSDEALALITDDCYITREDRPEVMIVEHIEIITSKEDGNYLCITGRGAEGLLARRIIWEQTTVSGRVDAAVYRLIDENAINPTNAERKLSIIMDVPNVSSKTIRAQYTGTNLLETVRENCKTHGLGFRAVTDDNAFVVPRLELFAGADRSEGQQENSPVIFSAEYENLLSSSYILDTEKYKNVAAIAGEGEGKARKRAAYGSASGLHRRELFVDARDLSTNNGEISDDDYTAQLQARGAENIAKNPITETFDGEIDTSNFVLDEDYTLGDIVTVENEYGIRKNVRIVAIVECWDENGYTAIPTYKNMEV